MPKSRKRRKRRSTSRPNQWGALELMERMPDGPDGRPFWRPWRLRRLMQFAVLGPTLPRWATSRWVLEQALQALHESRRPHVLRAMGIAIEIRGGEGRLAGVDQADARAKVIDHDWVFRQVLLYELGGLRHFIRRTASADLLAGADHIDEWALGRMGGYRLHERAPATLTWENLATGVRIEMPNIGSGVFIVPGETVIGRVVPVEVGSMFESTPLRVPLEVARMVAHAPDDWIDALRGGCDMVEPPITDGFWFGVLSDVPMPVVWAALLSGSEGPVIPTEAERARALLRVATGALGLGPEDLRPEELDVWACLAAAVLDPTVAVGLAEVVRPEDAAIFAGLGDALAEPAATVCRDLAAYLLEDAA